MATVEERLAALESAVANAVTKSDLEAWKNELARQLAAEVKASEERLNQQMHGLAAEFTVFEDRFSERMTRLHNDVVAAVAKPA